MRQIKFRAKSVDTYSEGEWLYGYLTKNRNENYCIKQDKWEPIEIDSKTICEFTGLHDKNGKEIYENDKCDFCVDDEYYVGVVEYDENCCAYYFVVNEETAFQIVETRYIEVIGNIYENPELL